ncbi:hypothetical protein BGZ65_012538, partial [Modicella reniformis]
SSPDVGRSVKDIPCCAPGGEQRAVNDSHWSVTEAVEDVLGDPSEVTGETVQTLTRMSSHAPLNVREAAADVLEGQDKLSEMSVQAQSGSLSDEDDEDHVDHPTRERKHLLETLDQTTNQIFACPERGCKIHISKHGTDIY